MKLIPKYQNAGLVARQDNTYVAKPIIPPKLIKRAYTPTQSYVSQDNRSGWQRKQDSKKADEEYKKYMEDKKMQQGLENLNGFLNFVDAATIATGVGSVVGKGLRWGGKKAANQLVKRKINKETQRQMANRGEDYTNRLILALGDRKDSPPNNAVKFHIDNKAFVSYLKDIGVDVSQFTNRDIRNLRQLRRTSIDENLPETGRYTLITDLLSSDRTLYDATLYSSSKKLPIGTINGEESLNKISIGKVEKLDYSESKVSEDLYNSIIQYGKQRGHDGVISGEVLESPEITYKVWKHFPNKKLISKTGAHYFNHGKTIKDPSLPSWDINNGKVYKLVAPSRFVPTKHTDIFNPEIINPITGKLNPPDWNSSDIYKAIIPLVGVSTINNKENHEEY